MTESQSIWSYRLAREDVPEGGLRVELQADETVRASLAKTAGLRELLRLNASFEITRVGHEELHVEGEVDSVVGQNCVITLDPIEKNLLEPIDLTFAPGNSGNAAEAAAQTSLAGDETEPPEEMTGGVIDLGAIAIEYFLLGIDPYPRKPGAVFETPAAGVEAAANPFAALASLKKSKPGDKA